MPFRRTTGIVSNLPSSDPKTEADVIMTAAALGFAASYIEKDQPIQFDMDPLDVREPAWTKAFNDAVGKLDRAIADYLQRSGRAPKNKVHAGTAPGYTKGAVIVGVYALAGQTAPPSISAPVLSAKGRALYDQIKAQSVPQYTGEARTPGSWTTRTPWRTPTRSGPDRRRASWLRTPTWRPSDTPVAASGRQPALGAAQEAGNRRLLCPVGPHHGSRGGVRLRWSLTPLRRRTWLINPPS